MLGNALLGLALICFIGACAVPESKSQPAGGILYRVAALFSSAKVFVAVPLIGLIISVFTEQALAQAPGAPLVPAWRIAAADFSIQAMQILGPPLLAWLAWQVNRWFGLKQEAERRDAFQIALTNAAGKMIQTAGSALQVAAIGSAARNKALAEGLAYLEQSAPEAIAFFKLTRNDLIEKLEAKVGLFIADAMTGPR